MENRVKIELVRHNGKILHVLSIPESDWKKINFVDYIAVDYSNKVIHEFRLAHGETPYQEMQCYADHYLG